MAKGDPLKREIITATQRFSNHPPRYTESSLVKKLEELGIGRPSTYAPTIYTVQKRGYVVKEDREGQGRANQVLVLNEKGLARKKKQKQQGPRNRNYSLRILVLL